MKDLQITMGKRNCIQPMTGTSPGGAKHTANPSIDTNAASRCNTRVDSDKGCFFAFSVTIRAFKANGAITSHCSKETNLSPAIIRGKGFQKACYLLSIHSGGSVPTQPLIAFYRAEVSARRPNHGPSQSRAGERQPIWQCKYPCRNANEQSSSTGKGCT